MMEVLLNYFIFTYFGAYMKLLINDKILIDKITNKKNYINSLVVFIIPFFMI